MSFIQFILILSRSTLAKMKVILNSRKAGQTGRERERERERESPVSVVDVGEEEEADYRFVIILSS